jgi:hypothetical protein
VQIAVANLVNNSFSFCVLYSVGVPHTFILLLVRMDNGHRYTILKVPLSCLSLEVTTNITRNVKRS